MRVTESDVSSPGQQLPGGRDWPVVSRTLAYVRDPQAALTNRDKAFASGAGWTAAAGPFFGRGLMFLDFAEHHLHRRIMQQAFTRDRLEGYTTGMQATIRDGVADWQPGTRFAAYPALKQLTLDITAQTFMGGAVRTSRAEMDRVNHAFVDYLPAHRVSHGDDLFSTLCRIETDDGERFSDDDVVNHMVFLMMAAHDTSTITLSTMMQYLGQHPQRQDRLRAEASHLGDDPTLGELDALPSFDLVMRECLRLVAPVPVLARQTVKDTTVLGVRVPAGHLALAAPHFSHHMAEYWTEPSRFDPERFASPRNEHKSRRHAWDPFGGGVHQRLGMFFAGAEVTSVLHHVLRRYSWTVDPDYRVPMNYHSLPFPNDGQPMHLTVQSA